MCRLHDSGVLRVVLEHVASRRDWESRSVIVYLLFRAVRERRKDARTSIAIF